MALIRHVLRLGLCNGSIVNLDFHAIPHFGDESVLEELWAGAKGKRMRGALTLIAQDAQSKYPQPMVHVSTIELRGYEGELR